MSEVITLSSDDEEVIPPPKKRIKLQSLIDRVKLSMQTLTKGSSATEGTSCIVLSDDDDDDVQLKVASAPETPSEDAQDWKLEVNGVESVDIIEEEVVTKEDVVEPQPPEIKAAEAAEVTLDDIAGQESSTVGSNINSKDKIESTNDIEKKLHHFLDECIQTQRKVIHRDLMNAKLPIVKKYYENLAKRNHNFASLKELIQSCREQLNSFPEKGILCFTEIYRLLKSEFKSVENAEISTGLNFKHMRKLEKTLSIIQRRIKRLDEAEVDFADEENSHYIQAGRYKERAAQIYKKLCQYRKEDPNYGRLPYCRLDFAGSSFTEINQAINRNYKNNMEFPTYFDLDKCIRKCVQAKQLQISEEKLKLEIRLCFEALGNLLQRRRKLDLLDSHKDFIESGAKDPAQEDPAINCKLQAHHSEANKKMGEIINKFVHLQETGVNPEISSDSEDSNIAESDNEAQDVI